MEPNYTFSIEISTGSEINEDLHDGVEISLGTPIGGLKEFILGIRSKASGKFAILYDEAT